jgi:hypothetical protein
LQFAAEDTQFVPSVEDTEWFAGEARLCECFTQKLHMPVPIHGVRYVVFSTFQESSAIKKFKNDIAGCQTALLNEKQDQFVTKIRLQGEVGWSKDMDVRFACHQNLIGSANFFRVATCVIARSSFEEFHLHLPGFCLFGAS